MRVLAVLALLPLLTACSDMDLGHLFSFGSSDDSVAVSRPATVAVAATPATLAAASGQNNFCLGVSRQDATTNGFDAATQARVAARSYQQCVAIFGAQN